jgi:hypothetical protein
LPCELVDDLGQVEAGHERGSVWVVVAYYTRETKHVELDDRFVWMRERVGQSPEEGCGGDARGDRSG